MVHDLTISTSLLFYCKYQCLLPVLRAAHVSVSSVNDMLCPVFCVFWIIQTTMKMEQNCCMCWSKTGGLWVVHLYLRSQGEKQCTWSEKFFLNDHILALISGTRQVCLFKIFPHFVTCDVTLREDQMRICTVLVCMLWYKL